jgi:RNA polymerase sigma-70 factor (ECF subfamily)
LFDETASNFQQAACRGFSHPASVDRFMQLLVAHQSRLYQYVRMLMPRVQDAEDVLQQTFIVMWRKYDPAQPESSFYAWATRIAYLEVLKSRERNAREATILDSGVLERIVAEEEAEPEYLAELKSLLEACLDRLPPDDRELIERRYQPGMLVGALAAELGRPVNSVSKSLGRIRRALWKCVNEAEAEKTAAEKGTVPICAKHTPGRPGKWGLSPFPPTDSGRTP